jgi:outer membrane protein
MKKADKTSTAKKLIVSIVLSLTLACVACHPAQAQGKTAYANLTELVYAMPDVKGIQLQLDTYKKQFVDQLTNMNNEYQQKGQEYEKEKAAMTDALRTVKESELNDLQKRIGDYENEARDKMAAKSNELTKPVIDKVMATVAVVAKERGYAIVLDSYSQNLIGSQILYASDADNITADIKKRLGL